MRHAVILAAGLAGVFALSACNQRTSDAVKAFQQMQGLTVTGIANHQTETTAKDRQAQQAYWLRNGHQQNQSLGILFGSPLNAH